MTDRIAAIRSRLEQSFAPAQLDIFDDSAAHVGHAGAAAGGGHFRVRIRAAAFAGKSPVQRHRMVFAAVEELLKTDIHALSIDAAEA